MNSFIQHHLQSNLSFLCRRFSISATPLLENPSVLSETKTIHAHIIRTGIIGTDIIAANKLLDGYVKCGSFGDALKVFDEMPNPSVFSWNLMISGCDKNGLFNESWRFFCKMYSSGCEMSEYSYGGVLSACRALMSKGNVYGEQVYGVVMKNGFSSNKYVKSGMIDLFVKLGRLEQASKVLFDDDELCDNVVCWNTIISGAAKSDHNKVALEMFGRMCRGYLMPTGFTFSSVLTACAVLGETNFGKGVQGWVIKCGVGDDIFVATAIVDLYAKCGAMGDAVKQFWQMPVRNVVSWTTIISGFVQKDDPVSALRFFTKMRRRGEEINTYTITSVVTACADRSMCVEAFQLHCWVIKTGFYSDPSVKSSWISTYSKIGAVDLCEMVFSETGDVIQLNVWSNMISSLAQNQFSQRAVKLFHQMLLAGIRPDKFCCASILSVVDNLSFGLQVHCYTLKTGLMFDVSVGSSLFTMYSKCGYLDESHEIFQLLDDKDNVSWASMMAGFVEHDNPVEAINLFREMLFEETVPDEMILTAVASACSALLSLKSGKEVHSYAIRHGMDKQTTMGGALVNMYSKCHRLDTAKTVYDAIHVKDLVSRSVLVSGYAQSGYATEAIQLVKEMLKTDLNIDSFILSSILDAVDPVKWPRAGDQMHAMTIKFGLESESSTGSSLVMMYSKCGSISDCCKAFEEIRKPDLISWTAMINSYAEHGKAVEALEVYELMRNSGVMPDSVTFVAVLSACSHAGLVEKGYFHLTSMMRDYGIQPGFRHYASMVDMLGRAGRLEEAMEFINDMPVKPDALIWGTLLAACKVHGNVELGRVVAKRFAELHPSEAGGHVILSNIFAEVGQWEQVQMIRREMKGAGMTKEPGWSFV
ncbi:hypothetical protein Leryth_001117 [Lithospermum erythrorhizon]|nr:hypothetical protein Leryth_001117 [Lithospermum erythrorhizon]